MRKLLASPLLVSSLVALSFAVSSDVRAQESFSATHIARLDILDPLPDAGTIGAVAIAAFDPATGGITFRISSGVIADSMYLSYRKGSTDIPIVGFAFEPDASTFTTVIPSLPPQLLASVDSGYVWLTVTRESDKARYADGPLLSISSALTPEPMGSEVVPPVTTDAVAHFGMTYDAVTNSFRYTSFWLDLNGTVTGARIGRAPKGSNGPIEFELPFGFESSQAVGTWSNVPLHVIAAARTGELYFELLTTAHPNGEIRGQIYPVETFTAFLESENEVPPVTASQGSGSAYLLITAQGTEEVFNKLQGVSAKLTSAPTMAHIHAGAIGVSGPPLTTLERPTPATIDLELASGSAGGPLSNEIVDQIREELTYINIHTDAFASGEIRGQLVPAKTNLLPLVEAVYANTQPSNVRAFYRSSVNTIVVTIEGEHTSKRIALSTVDGKIVTRTTSNGEYTELDAAELASGVYYVLIEGAGMYPVFIRR